MTDFWKAGAPPAPDALFTTIANWNTSDLKDIEWRGEKYLWSKSLEFLKFVEAPRGPGSPLNSPPPSAIRPRWSAFRRISWRFSNPDRISLEHDEYVDFIRASKGEFTVAKDQYVRLDTGWFSDRSACYLAAGRPVITQETGFTRLYGGDWGSVAFTTLEEIVEGVRAINADYPAHARAAYEIAAEHFEATKVLASLLERAGI